MECQEFRKYIPEFAACRLKYRQMAECLSHMENCASCKDELEIYFIVEYGIKEDAALNGPFVLKDIMEECFNRAHRAITAGRRLRALFFFLRILVYIAVFAAVLIFVTYFFV